MDDGSQNGQRGGDEETPEEHRSGHLQNLLDEVLTMMAEDAPDEDGIDGVVETVMMSLVDAVARQDVRPPKPLMDALAAWVGTEDPRDYLRGEYADERGRLADDTPEQIVRYLSATDDQFWPE